jgi:hypothetical protein
MIKYMNSYGCETKAFLNAADHHFKPSAKLQPMIDDDDDEDDDEVHDGDDRTTIAIDIKHNTKINPIIFANVKTRCASERAVDNKQLFEIERRCGGHYL